MSSRHYSWADHLVEQLDLALRTACKVDTPIGRARPECTAPQPPASKADATLASRLMRVNHTGEVCAQALYQGQALTAKTPELREHLWQAARDESDHLAWCASRVHELEGRTSLLNPAFYLGAFTFGAVAGLAGDRWSLGFVAETEKQVAEHLQDHLQKLPSTDGTSRAIVEQMKADEERHGSDALAAGGKELPAPIRGLMRLASKVMTTTTYWI